MAWSSNNRFGRTQPGNGKLDKRKWLITLEDTSENPLTRDRIMNWMASTGFIEGFIGARIHPLDRPYYDDYLQEVWLQILEVDPEKLIFLYRAGKGRFTNYIKCLIMNNIRSDSSLLFKHIRADKKKEVYLDDDQWSSLLESDEADVENILTSHKEGSEWVLETEPVSITTELHMYENDRRFEDFQESQR